MLIPAPPPKSTILVGATMPMSAPAVTDTPSRVLAEPIFPFIVPFLVKTPGFSRERLQSLCYNFTALVISDTV